jgi:hypothetical protein
VVGVAQGELTGLVRARRNDHGVVAVIQQGGDVVHTRLETQFDALVHDLLDFPVEAIPGETVRRNTHAHHPARDRQRIEHGRGMAQPDEVQASSQPCRTRADDGDAFAGRRRVVLEGRARDGLVAHVGQIGTVGIRPIRDKALEAHDIDRIVDKAPAARVLALAVADAPAHRGERVLAPDGPVGIRETFFAHQGDIAHGALIGGAGVPAGRDPAFVDGIGVGNRLRGEAIAGFALAQAPVKRIVERDWAGVGALAAAGTHRLVDVTRLAAHAHVKIAHVARHGFDFAVSE